MILSIDIFYFKTVIIGGPITSRLYKAWILRTPTIQQQYMRTKKGGRK